VKEFTEILMTVRNRLGQPGPATEACDPVSNTLPTRLFTAVILLHVTLSLCLQPRWVCGGAMFAEMAVNYYAVAESQPPPRGLFTTDCGYIPLPPRLLAAAGHLLRLPSVAVPFFYTWSAILISGALVATFCLREFRPLVPNDALRFMTAVAFVCAGDFEVRTFINFPNYAAFPILAVASLAIADRERRPPWWAWLLPVFMISKPAMLATAPAMVAAGYYGNPRWRPLVLTCLSLATVQVGQLLISQSTETGVAMAGESSVIQRLCALSEYVCFGTTCLLLGRWVPRNAMVYLPLFAMIVTGGVWLIRSSTSRSRVLVVFGALAIIGNISINCIAIASEWGPHLMGLAFPTVNRRIFVAFAGAVALVTGVAAALTPKHKFLGTAAFTAWLLLSGWLSHGLRTAREQSSPMMGNSYWQEMADAIDTAQRPLCVPIDPFGWTFGRDCRVLGEPSPPLWIQPCVYRAPAPIGENGCVFTHAAPHEVTAGELHAIAVVLRPTSQVRTRVESTAVLSIGNGESIIWRGSRDIPATGGLLLIGAERGTLVSDVRAISMSFEIPVEIAHTTDDAAFLMWMGRNDPNIPH